MRRFPYRMLFVCIFLPPIFYMLTINVLEGYLKRKVTQNLNQVIIHDYEALYEGRYTIKEEITRNVNKYLVDRKYLYILGVRTGIQITADNNFLYPSQYKKDLKETITEPTENINYTDVAAENFKILNEGMILSVDIRIKHNSWLANSILVIYVLLAVLTIFRFIRKNISEAKTFEEKQEESIRKLSDQLLQAETQLSEIQLKEDEYLSDIEKLRRDRKNLSTDIDGLLEETERLEAGLETQRSMREKREKEVDTLTEEIDKLRSRLNKPKKKKQMIANKMKRFRVLYKNVAVTERAIEGFLSLPDRFQLKAEEIIHRLNEDEANITVKRKVFGKGGKMNILEAEFSYSGRIYFQKNSGPKTKIVIIGTKKSQDQDLAFLECEYG